MKRYIGIFQGYPIFAPQAALSASTKNGNVINRIAAVPTQPTGVTSYTAYKSSAGIYRSANVSISTGVSTGSATAQSIVIKVQHGTLADGSDMADAPTTAYITGVVPSAITADNITTDFDINLDGLNQYIRVVATVSFTGGTTPAQFVTGQVTFSDCSNLPAN